jgi:hypothetical protein
MGVGREAVNSGKRTGDRNYEGSGGRVQGSGTARKQETGDRRQGTALKAVIPLGTIIPLRTVIPAQAGIQVRSG